MTLRVPGYKADQLIGYGSSSEVWSGRSTRSGQAVALKLVRAVTAADAKALRSEADLLRRLDHANLIRIHDVAQTSDALVLVLDLADGGSLADLLLARGRLTPGEAASALAPIGAALAYAHSQQTVHGDVSASNVLFAANGLPLLADLGMARLLDRLTPEPDPVEELRCTPAYVAPEVATTGVSLPAADVFSLAAVLAHALTGERVWPGTTGAELLQSAGRGELRDLTSALESAGAPPDMRDLVVRALAIEPRRRPSAADFALGLRLSVSLTPVELAAGRARPAPRPPAAGRHRKAPDRERTSAHPGRPSYERAVDLAPDRGQLTYGVRLARVEPHRRSRLRSRVAVASAVSVAAAALGLAGGWLAVHASGSQGTGAQSQRQPSPIERAESRQAVDRTSAATRASSSRTASALSVPSPPGSSASRQLPTDGHGAADYAQALTELDGIRERAFAQRRPDLLDSLYASPELQARDAAMIAGLVPVDCGLFGVRTTYRDVRQVRSAADSVVVRATASLAASTLECGSATSGSAAGLPPTPMEITLVRTSAGLRVSKQDVVS